MINLPPKDKRFDLVCGMAAWLTWAGVLGFPIVISLAVYRVLAGRFWEVSVLIFVLLLVVSFLFAEWIHRKLRSLFTGGRSDRIQTPSDEERAAVLIFLCFKGNTTPSRVQNGWPVLSNNPFIKEAYQLLNQYVDLSNDTYDLEQLQQDCSRFQTLVNHLMSSAP